MKQQKRTNYTIKNVETVAAGKDVQARLFTLAPGEVIPWHSHSEIADHFFVLDGELTVETRAPDDYRTLGIGERYQINAGHAHQTSNRGTRDCRFLIVQDSASDLTRCSRSRMAWPKMDWGGTSRLPTLPSPSIDRTTYSRSSRCRA